MNDFHFHQWRQPFTRSSLRDLKYLALTSSIILVAYTPIFQIVLFGEQDVFSGNPANTIAGALLVAFVPRILARMWRTHRGKATTR